MVIDTLLYFNVAAILKTCVSVSNPLQPTDILRNLRFRGYFMSAAPLHGCKMFISTNILVHNKEDQNVSSIAPIRLNNVYSIRSGHGNTCFQDGGQIQRQKNIDFHYVRAQKRAFAFLIGHYL
jgi:hypothetical protein